MRTIDDEWERLRTSTLENAGEIQLNEMRKAFYAGALSMFNILNEASDTLEEDAAVMVMDGLNEELIAFFRSI